MVSFGHFVNTQNPIFISAMRSVLDSTRIRTLLEKRRAFVVERIARGGGETRWYLCRDIELLDQIATSFRPGSCVSFYFDDRIRSVVNDAEIDDIVKEQPDFVILARHDDIRLNVDFLSCRSEVEEFRTTVKPGDELYFGAFPARDNDGVNAVTINLPDADGISRTHPH